MIVSMVCKLQELPFEILLLQKVFPNVVTCVETSVTCPHAVRAVIHLLVVREQPMQLYTIA